MSTDPDAQQPAGDPHSARPAAPVSLEELTAVVSELDADLTALTSRVAAMRATPAPGQQNAAAPRERAWWWPGLSLEQTAQAAERLSAWVEHALTARHPHHGQKLLPCWWRHPCIVDELSALRAVWHGAYIGDSRDPSAAAEYLNRWLPAAMARIEATFSRTRCTTAGGNDLHKDTDEKYHRPQWTPAQVAEFLTTLPAAASLTPEEM
jgi:hypothetical protein